MTFPSKNHSTSSSRQKVPLPANPYYRPREALTTTRSKSPTSAYGSVHYDGRITRKSTSAFNFATYLSPMRWITFERRKTTIPYRYAISIRLGIAASKALHKVTFQIPAQVINEFRSQGAAHVSATKTQSLLKRERKKKITQAVAVNSSAFSAMLYSLGCDLYAVGVM